MFVCVRVCLYLFERVRTYVRVCVRVCMCPGVSMRAYACVRVHVCLCACVFQPVFISISTFIVRSWPVVGAGRSWLKIKLFT